MSFLSEEALAVAHSFGHDVPGLIGGDLLPSGDPITRQRVMDTMREMAERIAELERELAEARESNTKLLLVAQEWKRDWLKSPVFETFAKLKHGIVGDVLCALQEGEISRGKAAECLAEIAHGATEVRLPRYRGYFAEDETPVEKCERLEAINAQLVEALGKIENLPKVWRIAADAANEAVEIARAALAAAKEQDNA